MKEKPIIFKDWEIRAVKENRKSQFRRIVKPQPLHDGGRTPRVNYDDHGSVMSIGDSEKHIACPYEVGDRLWVRETFRASWEEDTGARLIQFKAGGLPKDIPYNRGGKLFDGTDSWCSPVAMPRWASRITLEVTRVRVERLSDMTTSDALREGIDQVGDNLWRDYSGKTSGCRDPLWSFRSLWESINGPGSWEASPWVWVIEFKREGGER